MPLEARPITAETIPPWSLAMLDSLKEGRRLTYQHSLRTGLIARELWNITQPVLEIQTQWGVTPEDVYLAGVLHDVSKKDIPVEILAKSDELTDEEMVLISSHPFAGAAEIEPYDATVAAIVRGHHRWGKNGIQYPFYYADTSAQKDMAKENYPGVKIAQLIVAVADKTDVGINRTHGIHGTLKEEEFVHLLIRFAHEINHGFVRDDWLQIAVELAWEAGELALM